MPSLSFDVPAQQEPTDLVRELAFKLRADYGGRAGEHWVEQPNPLDGIRRIRVEIPSSREAREEASIRALWCLVNVDLWCLRHARRMHRAFRPLYQSVCYRREKNGSEVWQSTDALYKRGFGDCEDLTCARVAERLSVGDYCRPGIKRQVRPSGGILYHVIIGNPDGTIEDPSGSLGMKFGEDDDLSSTVDRCRIPPSDG